MRRTAAPGGCYRRSVDAEDLTRAQIEERHAALLALRVELTAQIASMKERTATVDLDEPIGRLTRMDAMQQREMAAEERRRHEVRLAQVGGALAAIDAGTYGDCKRCEEPIGYARLAARPESPFCVPCMSKLERR